MLHILWLILKVILIILGSLLGLIVLVVFLVLFCPLRYRAFAGKEQEKISARVNVSWLFHAISVWAEYEGKKAAVTVKIFGISLETFKKLGSRFKRTGKEKKETAELEEEPLPEVSGQEEDQPLLEEETKKKVPPAAETVYEERIEPDGERSEAEKEKKPNLFRRIGRSIQNLWKKICRIFWAVIGIPGRIFGFFHKISLTRQSLCDKIAAWKRFLEDERFQEAWQLAWKEIRKLLHHIVPRKLSGIVTFGMENPALTGQILAVVAATRPLHKDAVSVIPVFEEEVLEGKLFLKGRIYLCILVKIGVKLYFDKNVKFVMKVMKKNKEG